jgi:hypothetical protein
MKSVKKDLKLYNLLQCLENSKFIYVYTILAIIII